MDVGRLTARLDAVLDDGAFDRFDKRLDSARREAKKDVKATLRADAETRGFDKFGNELDKAQREARKGAKTKLEADVDKKGFDKYDRAMRDADGSADKVNKSHGRLVGVLGKSGAAFRVVGTGAAAAGAGIGILGVKTVGIATDINESITKNQVLFGQYAKDIDDWSRNTAESFGISRRAALEYTGTFGNLFNALGISQKESAGMSKSLVELASDMASFNNSSPEEALEAIRSGLVGETEPLRRFGVNMNDATLRTEALKLGLVKSTKEALDPQAKALAANALITKQTAAAHGDFGRTSGGLANQQRILKARLEDLGGEIGGKLLPVALKMAEGFNALLDVFSKTGGESKKMGSAIGGVRKAFSDAFNYIKRIVDDNRDTIRKLGDVAKTNFNAIVGAVRSMGKVFGDVFGSGSGFGKDIRTVIRFIGQFLSVMTQASSNIIRRILPGIVTAFKGMATVIRGVIRVISGILHGDFSKVWAGVKDIFGGAIRVVLGMMRAMTAPVRAIYSAIGRVILSAFRKIVGFFADLGGDIWRQLKRALGFVARFGRELASDGASLAKRFVRRVIDFWSDLPGDVWNVFKRVLSRVADFAGDVVSKGANLAKKFVSRVLDFWRDLPGKAWNTLVDTLDRIGDFERKAASKAADAGKAIVDRTVGGLRSLPGRVMDIFGDLLGRLRGIPGRMASIFTGIGRKLAGAVRKAFNDIIPDSIKINIPDKLPGLPDEVKINIPQLAEGGKVGPGFGGFKAFIAGEGKLPEWVISQEGDRSKNIGWAMDALRQLTGRDVGLHALGKGRGTNALIQARGKNKGIENRQKQVERMQRELSQKEALFDVSQEEFVVENPDGTSSLNSDAIRDRAAELQALADDQGKISKEIADLYKVVQSALGAWITAGKRLRTQLRRAKRKNKDDIRGAISEADTQSAELRELLYQVGGVDGTGGDWRDSETSRLGYLGEKSAVEGTQAPAAPPGEPAARFGGDYLSDAQDAELGGLLEAQAAAGTTAGAEDDTAAAAALRAFYQARLNQGGLSQQQRIDLLGLIGAPPEAPSTPGTDTTTTAPSPIEIATAALAALDQFQSSRGDLFGQFGSNFSAGGISGAAGFAAGTRFFGAVPGAGSIGQAAGGGVTIYQQYDAPPPDPHTWTRGVDFELRAAI